jgi:hypothetical protein
MFDVYVPYLTYVVLPRKSKSEVEVSKVDVEPSQIVVDPKVMSSPGVITRNMTSLSPTSPGPITRRMTSISPGGINRRFIISQKH